MENSEEKLEVPVVEESASIEALEVSVEEAVEAPVEETLVPSEEAAQA